MQRHHIRTKDVLHIACSVYTQSDYLITTDKQLFNLKLGDMKIINPYDLEVAGALLKERKL